jgi:hypothetical protein
MRLRQEIAYFMLTVLALLAAYGLWKLRKRSARRPRHIHVDLTGKRQR